MTRRLSFKLGETDFHGGWRPDIPSKKDFPFRLSRMADVPLDDLPKESPDRRALNQNAPVMDQGNIGSCVGCSSSYAVDFLRRTDRDTLSTKYSALFQYYVARIADGMQWEKVDSGAYIRDSMDCLRTIGIPPEAQWRYNTIKFARKPVPSAYTAALRWKLGSHWRCANMAEIMKALSAGCAVVGGIAVYSSMLNREVEQTGRVPMPNVRADSLEGGHALYFDRYTSEDRLVRFQNSWNTTWGDGGYGYIPFAYLDDPNLADDFWALSCEAPETTPWKD